MDKHAQSWVYRCADAQCGLTGIVYEADLRSLETTGPVTCPYSGHTMDRIRKATEEDHKTLEPLTPVVPRIGGPIVLQADSWWPMKHMRVVSTRIIYGLGGISGADGYALPASPDPTENFFLKDGITRQGKEQADESGIVFTEEAAAILKATPSRTTFLARTGVIPAFKVGKKEWRYSRKALLEWVQAQAKGRFDLQEPMPERVRSKPVQKPRTTRNRTGIPTDVSPEALRKAINSMRNNRE